MVGDFELEFSDLDDEEFLEFCDSLEGQDIEGAVLESIQNEIEERGIDWAEAYGFEE